MQNCTWYGMTEPNTYTAETPFGVIYHFKTRREVWTIAHIDPIVGLERAVS